MWKNICLRYTASSRPVRSHMVRTSRSLWKIRNCGISTKQVYETGYCTKQLYWCLSLCLMQHLCLIHILLAIGKEDTLQGSALCGLHGRCPKIIHKSFGF